MSFQMYWMVLSINKLLNSISGTLENIIGRADKSIYLEKFSLLLIVIQ